MHLVITILGIAAGVWFGIRAGMYFPLILVWAMGGAFVTIMIATLSVPKLVNAFQGHPDPDMSPEQYSRGIAVLFFIGAGLFIIFTPSNLKGPFLGWANPAIPSALLWGGLMSVIRFKNPRVNLTVLGIFFWLSIAGAFWVYPLQQR
jgi:hypothetical protein